jgi:asparagine synthase (glutamine-hydrolysing)
MCGIWAFIQLQQQYEYQKLFDNFMKLRPRGPDMSSFNVYNNVYIGFHRLAIMNPSFTSNQPYIIKDGDRTIVFICNGEIYNFKNLIDYYDLPINDNSDCMTIPQLYLKFVKKQSDMKEFSCLFTDKVKGEYAFILFEYNNSNELVNLVAGRDEIGVRPLYYNKPTNNSDVVFSSEIKGLNFFKGEVMEYEPGTIMNIAFVNNMIHNIKYYDFRTVYHTAELIHDGDMFEEGTLLYHVRKTVTEAVERRLTADRPIAFLLSGGVDSSLVAGIATRLLKKQINTFCCGMNEGTDLLYARKVAQYINSNHTEVLFTSEEGLAAIRDVIWTTETWDTTSIRASVGQYLVCKHIGTKTDARVVLVGEGPDEVCSSYLFNFYAPNGEALHTAAKDYVEKIHMYDGKRADRCISRWGLEGRVALLDPEFIKAYWNIPAEWRMPRYKGIEKWWLRQAFEGTNTIPNDVLWRKKEAFSDGVSGKERSWFEIIQDFIKTQVSEEEMEASDIEAPTLEAYYYKKIFIELFSKERLNIIPSYWQPKWTNMNAPGYIDPSARVLNVY